MRLATHSSWTRLASALGLLMLFNSAAWAGTVEFTRITTVQNHVDVRLAVNDATAFETLTVQIDDQPPSEYAASAIHDQRVRIPIERLEAHAVQVVLTVHNAGLPSETTERQLDYTPLPPGSRVELTLEPDSVKITEGNTTFEVTCTSPNITWPPVIVKVGNLTFEGVGVVTITLASSAMGPITGSCAGRGARDSLRLPNPNATPTPDFNDPDGTLFVPNAEGPSWPTGLLVLAVLAVLAVPRRACKTALLLSVAVACDSDSPTGTPIAGPGSAQFVIHSLGAGPQNTQPIFPLHHQPASATDTRTALRVGDAVHHTLATTGGADYATLIENEHGVFLVPSMPEAQPTPLLIAPKSVRVGMRWTSTMPLSFSPGRLAKPKRGSQWQHEIAAMLETGGRRSWLMHAVGPEVLDYLKERVGYYAQRSIVFEEGVGPLGPITLVRPFYYEIASNEQNASSSDQSPKGTLRTTQRLQLTPDAIHAAALVPTDLPVLTPELINGGAPIGEESIVEDVSIAEHPDEGVVLRWLGYGPPGFYNNGSGIGPNGESAGAAPGHYMNRVRHCATVVSPTATIEPSQDTSEHTECAHAMTSFIDQAGAFHEPRNGLRGGVLAAIKLTGGAGYHFTDQAWALFNGPNGSLRGLWFKGVDRADRGSLGLADWGPPGPTDGAFSLLTVPTEAFYSYGNPFQNLGDLRLESRAFLIEPTPDTGLRVVLRGDRGRVFASSQLSPTHQSAAHRLGPFMPRGSASRRGESQRMLSVTAQGLVQETQWRGTLERHTLAQLALPPEHTPMRIVVLEGNDAFLFTVVGSTQEPDYSPFIRQTPGDTYLWRVTLPEPKANPQPDPLAELTRAETNLHDRAARYCPAATLGASTVRVQAAVEQWSSVIDPACKIVVHDAAGPNALREPSPLARAEIVYRDYGRIAAPPPVTEGFAHEPAADQIEGICAKMPQGRFCEHHNVEAFGFGHAKRLAQFEYGDAHAVHGRGIWQITQLCDSPDATPVPEVQGQCGAPCCEAAVFATREGEAVYSVPPGPTGLMMNGRDGGALYGETWQVRTDGVETELPARTVRRQAFSDGLRCTPTVDCERTDGIVVTFAALADIARAEFASAALVDSARPNIIAEGMSTDGIHVSVLLDNAEFVEEQTLGFALFDPRTDEVSVVILGPDGFPDFAPLPDLGTWRVVADVDTSGELLVMLDFRTRDFRATGMVLRTEGDTLIEYDYPESDTPNFPETRYPNSLDSGWLVERGPIVQLSALIERTRHQPAEPVPAMCVPMSESCNGADDDCDGVIDNDPDENTTIDESCSSLNRPGTCVDGACQSDCAPGYTSCDASPDCETLLGTVTDCGGCDDPCGAGEACTDGACHCPGGGNVGSDAHCGTCGDACDDDAYCDDGACIIPPDRVEVGQQAACVGRAGALFCFGKNDLVPSGAGLYVPPTRVEGFNQVTDFALSGGHACLIDDGQVFCWGSATLGRTGNDGDARSPRQVVLPGLNAPAVRVGVGAAHSCALAGGDVYCWGDNSTGQLGTNTPGGPDPVAATDHGDVVHVSVGEQHTCYLRENGDVHCFGRATNGELGADTGGATAPRLYPISGDEVLATGAFTFVRAGDTWHGSGNAAYGQLGDTPAPGRVFDPVEIPELAGATDLHIEQTHCFIGPDALIRCGGRNDSGELGDGTTGPNNQDVPDVTHAALGPVRSLGGYSATRPSFCAITETHDLLCWGDGALHGGPQPVLEPTELLLP
jgi:hypothetical protein